MRYYTIILLLFSCALWGQEKRTPLVLARIFGSHCPDTLTNPMNKKLIYTIEKKDNNETFITAYKSGKKKWSTYVDNLFGDNNPNVQCIDLYNIDGIYRIRVFNSYSYTGNKKAYHIDLSLKNGKLIDGFTK
jgi:hypothetical protein